MASSSSNFLDGLKFYFITKKLEKWQHKILTEKIKRFGGTVSSHFDRSTTHVLFPREVGYQRGDTVVLVSIDCLSDCIGERKLVPTAQSGYVVCSSRGLRGRESREFLETRKAGKDGKAWTGKEWEPIEIRKEPWEFQNGGGYCVFEINRLSVCNPIFFGPLLR